MELDKYVSGSLDYIHKEKEDIGKKAKDIEALTLHSDEQDTENYLGQINFQYQNAVFLYCIGHGFEYAALDHMRKMIELTIRYFLKKKPKDNLSNYYCLIKHELQNFIKDEKKRDELYEIYQYCCKSVHAQHVPLAKELDLYEFKQVKEFAEINRKLKKDGVEVEESDMDENMLKANFKKAQEMERIDESVLVTLNKLVEILNSCLTPNK